MSITWIYNEDEKEFAGKLVNFSRKARDQNSMCDSGHSPPCSKEERDVGDDGYEHERGRERGGC